MMLWLKYEMGLLKCKKGLSIDRYLALGYIDSLEL